MLRRIDFLSASSPRAWPWHFAAHELGIVHLCRCSGTGRHLANVSCRQRLVRVWARYCIKSFCVSGATGNRRVKRFNAS